MDNLDAFERQSSVRSFKMAAKRYVEAFEMAGGHDGKEGDEKKGASRWVIKTSSFILENQRGGRAVLLSALSRHLKQCFAFGDITRACFVAQISGSLKDAAGAHWTTEVERKCAELLGSLPFAGERRPRHSESSRIIRECGGD